MSDRIYDAFLKRQFEEGMALARESDLFALLPVAIPGSYPSRYIARFQSKCFVQQPDGQIAEHDGFSVGIWFAPDHLRHVEPGRILTWLEPMNVWHPNLRAPFVCAGHIGPGAGIVELIYQAFEIGVWANWAPHDALNPEAGQWARNAPRGTFPTERRPLKRRPVQIAATPVPAEVTP
jgi:hypothetical protein